MSCFHDRNGGLKSHLQKDNSESNPALLACWQVNDFFWSCSHGCSPDAAERFHRVKDSWRFFSRSNKIGASWECRGGGFDVTMEAFSIRWRLVSGSKPAPMKPIQQIFGCVPPVLPGSSTTGPYVFISRCHCENGQAKETLAQRRYPAATLSRRSTTIATQTAHSWCEEGSCASSFTSRFALVGYNATRESEPRDIELPRGLKVRSVSRTSFIDLISIPGVSSSAVPPLKRWTLPAIPVGNHFRATSAPMSAPMLKAIPMD
jgi:hypothetical protein